MSRGRRYSSERKLNYKKVFAVIMAFVVLVIAILMIKKVLTKAKNTKPVEVLNYFALYQNDKWGILGSNGEIIINPMYQEMPIVVDKYKDVFLCTYDINEEDGTYKTKAVNSKNEEIWTNYDKIEALENYDESGNVWYEKNVLKVQKNGLWGLIDLSGKEMIAPSYTSIDTLKHIQNSLIIEKDGLYGLANDSGTILLEPQYKEILGYGNDYRNGYITVNQEDKYGIVNTSGKKVLENKYQKIDNIYSEKYFVVRDNDKQQLIDKNEENVLSEGYDEIIQIADSGIVYTKNEKKGLMDFQGNKKIDEIYDELKEINKDVFLAKKDGKCGVIDLEQNEKIAYIYKDIFYNKKAGIYVAENEDYTSTVLNSNFEVKLTGIISTIDTDNGYFKIKVSDEYKYYNFKFEEKDAKDLFISNKIFVSKNNGKFGFIDNKGNVVVDYIYDDATELNSYGYAGVKKDGLWGAINSSGEVVIEPYYNLEDNLVIDFVGKWHLGLDLNMNYYCEK